VTSNPASTWPSTLTHSLPLVRPLAWPSCRTVSQGYIQRVCHATLDFIQVPGFPRAIRVLTLTHSRRNAPLRCVTFV
jgi:hypothetical protein